jgi:hypothetical protein
MRGLKRTAAGAAAIALSIGVLAGCGSSDSGATTAAEATTAAPALTNAEYVAKVNAICTKIDDTANSIENEDGDTIAQAKEGIAELTANAKAGIASLKALTPSHRAARRSPSTRSSSPPLRPARWTRRS